jgi:ankyrin repeat protein/TPR repeat protein
MREIDQDLCDASKDGDWNKAKHAIEEGGANIRVENCEGWTPLHAASWNGHEAVVSLLLETGAGVNDKEHGGWTSLHLASLKGYEAVVSLLLIKGADVNAQTNGGWTPLHYASEKGAQSVVSVLLERGAEVNVENSFGCTPLHKASQNGHEDIVSLLLEHGADIEAKGGDDENIGDTPLHDASKYGCEAVIALLLEHGANIEAKNKNGETPIYWASRKGQEAVVSLLLEKGADPSVTNLTGKTPLQTAQEENNQNCVAAMEQFQPRQAGKKRFENECSEKFKTSAALDGELQRLQGVIDAANDSLDPNVNSANVAAKDEYDMILPLCKWPQYMPVCDLESEIAKLEEQARSMDIGEERIAVLQKRNELKQYLDGEVLDRAKTPLQLALEQLSDDIRRALTCPISGDIMRDPVILYRSGKTFDRESLCTWLLRNQTPRCPWTNVPLERQMPYTENRDTCDTLTWYLGAEAYERYDDSVFKLQYQALWNAPAYEEIAALLYGMNFKQIDWTKAQERATEETNQNDAIIIGFKALLLHPGVFSSSRVHKDEDSSRREWEQAETLGLTVLAGTGNMWAQWIKGMYLHAVLQDYDTAKSLYELSAEQGLALAQNSLGTLYEEDNQFDTAEVYYKQASLQGHALAQYNLAMLKDPDSAAMRPYLDQAACQGHASSLYYMGTLYYDSDVAEQDLNMAVTYFERSAKQGHAGALNNLVTLFLKHQLVPKDNDVKRQVFERASEQGDNILVTYVRVASLLFGMNQLKIDWAEAQRIVTDQIEADPILVGFKAMLLHPDIFPDQRLSKSETMSLRTCLRAAWNFGLSAKVDDGNAWAQWLKGTFDECLEEDYDSAKKLYQLAANQGFALGQFNLGKLYQDDDQFDVAMKYYEQAAVEGHAGAQYNLAMLNQDDRERMLGYLEQAAAQEYADALYYLGTLYFDSEVVPRDYKRAREYYQRAADQGHNEAREALENLPDGTDDIDQVHE